MHIKPYYPYPPAGSFADASAMDFPLSWRPMWDLMVPPECMPDLQIAYKSASELCSDRTRLPFPRHSYFTHEQMMDMQSRSGSGKTPNRP